MSMKTWEATNVDHKGWTPSGGPRPALEPLTQGEARALLCAKELLDSGELPGAVYDALAAWVTRKLGIKDMPRLFVNEHIMYVTDDCEPGGSVSGP